MKSVENEQELGRVLPTLNEDGTRRWIDPKLSTGRFLSARVVVGYLLIALFTLLPFLEVDGRPSIFLDLPRREFTFFGFTFYPTDTLLLGLFLLAIFIGIFLVTALFGRVWCGWACPQTVYLELVYRPIEKVTRSIAKRLGQPVLAWVRFPLYGLVSLHLANTFLAYFVGAEAVSVWVWQSPSLHPAPFALVVAVAGLMLLDFAWFREQLCVVACPYARLQSALLDKDSLIVGYDGRRGEPRGARRKSALPVLQGDCIDCKACVRTCPTGIDIRDGLQLECVGCAQCIDACDRVMVKIGKPKGLIRYSSQNALAGAARRLLRPRVILYPAILVVLAVAFGLTLAGKRGAEVTVLRGIDAPFVVDGDAVRNQLRVRVKNRTRAADRYTIEVLGGEGLALIAPESPLSVEPGAIRTTGVFVTAPRASFEKGRREVTFRVTSGAGEVVERAYRLLGPRGGEAR